MAPRRLVLPLLAALLAGCLEPSADPAGGDGSDLRATIEFDRITADGAWAVFGHVDGDCLSVADHQWEITGGDGRERQSEPLVWRVDTDEPGSGGPSRWCPGQRRAFGLDGSGLARLRIVEPDGGTVAIVAGPDPFEASFSKEEAEDRITIVTASEDADWNRLGIRAEAEGTEARPADLAGAVAVDGRFRRLSDSMDGILAGDAIALCGTSGATGPMTYTLADLWSNKIVYVTTFQDIRAC